MFWRNLAFLMPYTVRADRGEETGARVAARIPSPRRPIDLRAAPTGLPRRRPR